MSVIHFEADELGCVCDFLVHRHASLGRNAAAIGLYLRYWAKHLAAYSRANTRAAAATYPREKFRAASEASIMDASRDARGMVRAAHDRALGVIRLMPYNAVANNGKDYLTGKALAAMCEIQHAAISHLMDREDARAQGAA